MTPWIVFIVLYGTTVLILNFLAIKINPLRAKRYCQTIGIGTIVMLIADILATQRGLWLIPIKTGVTLFGAPAEDILFMPLVVIHSLALYSISDYLLCRRRAHRKKIEPPRKQQ